MGRTKKPCPCCKEVDSSRSSDSICWNCQNKFAEYEHLKKILNEQQEQTTNYMKILVGPASYLNEYYFLPGKTISATDFPGLLQEAFFKLVMAASIETSPSSSFKKEAELILGKAECLFQPSAHRIIPRGLGEAIIELRAIIKPLSQEMYNRGQAHAGKAIKTIEEIKQLVKGV